MFIKLDSGVKDILCCSLCNGKIELLENKYVCIDCGSEYCRYSIDQGEHKEYVFDFRINRPDYCIPDSNRKWIEAYKYYKNWHEERKVIDEYKRYLTEIDSVNNIYTQEFSIKGKVLDVGGGVGKTRHFFNGNDIQLYVSVDPYPEIFKDLEMQPNLLKAYPCLKEPCNFLLCNAENLPFKKNSFDWVHMRSVLDHFQDPYLAIREAYRVLKNEGTLFVGTSVCGKQLKTKSQNNFRLNSIVDRIISVFKEDGLSGIVNAVSRKITRNKNHTDHTFHWKYEDLIDLMHITEFTVEKEHWPKSSFDKIVFFSAKKSGCQ